MKWSNLTMNIPDNFKFSASNLKDYLDCPRRFELRYLEFLKWPAIQSEPVLELERFIEDGKTFHRIIYQHLCGIPADKLTPFIKGNTLSRWWHSFTTHQSHFLVGGQKMPEFKVVVPFEGFILTGQFDLLVRMPDNRMVIYDWKTTSVMPNILSMRRQIQSRLYPLLISIIGQEDMSKYSCIPDQINMVYWFPDYPESSININYSNYQFQEDRAFFKSLLNEIIVTKPGNYLMTPDERRCLYCQYRSLCNRGETSGDWKLDEESTHLGLESSIEIDLDHVMEIEY
jgi:hypothetical protein